MRLSAMRGEEAKSKDLSALSRASLQSFKEGLSAQGLNIASYSAEMPTMESLQKLIRENSYSIAKKHHEIYLSDHKRNAQNKLKTILRQPISKRRAQNYKW